MIHPMHYTLQLLLLLMVPVLAYPQELSPSQAINTQAAGEHPPTPEVAAAKISVPTGFEVTLFAGEPHVHQPIAFDIDDRGRLWVVECYTYQGNYDLNLRDRILILEDTDGDGDFDTRKIFWDEGQRLTGIALGFGGVWVTSAPHLLFLPDQDQDDLPDAPARILIDGFSTRARHNMVNGLRWGPDGWLYGRHGITDTSIAGTPETPSGKRIRLNCAIWRYHPVHKQFQVVTHGTTNPWGLDYNDHGQWFFTNNVINHLWHVVPGAHYQRMFGDDFNPHLYQLIPPTADHFHWDTLGKPGVTDNSNRKKYDGRHDQHGGGHSHAGGMIYLGGKWPDEYRNTMLMCNTHGRRVNMDYLVRQGTGYVAKHGKDFLIANDPWFRGVELRYGPEGDVYVTDWSDLGECHDRDGVHRTSGRIYKIRYTAERANAAVALADPATASPGQLVQLQLHANDWYVRHARRRLQEMAFAGNDLAPQVQTLRKMFETHPEITRKLRALWCLYCMNATSEDWLIQLLDHPNEHIRLWACRLLVDTGPPSADAVASLSRLAQGEQSGLVRLYLASALQQLPLGQRWGVARPLCSCSADRGDRVQPLMLWYGIEPAVADDPETALTLSQSTVFPLIRQHIARRLASRIDDHPDPVTRLFELAAQGPEDKAIDYLEGIAAALRGRRRIDAKTSWRTIVQSFDTSTHTRLKALAQEILVVFGDGRTIESLLAVARNKASDPSARQQALKVVIDARPEGIESSLMALRSDRVVGATAIRGLAAYESPEISKQLIKMLGNAKHDHRPAIIDTLASRTSYAKTLLNALANGALSPADLPAATATRIASLGDSELGTLLELHWGTIQASSAEKQESISQFRSRLSPDALSKANRTHGRTTFAKICGNCHTLFGQGSKIGPDLTGSNRDSVDYLLDNIIDPSRIVPRGMRQVLYLMDDGRIVSGVPVREDTNTVTVQTATDILTLDATAVEQRKQQQTSLMPEGLLKNLTPREIRDLFSYLQSSSQVPEAKQSER